MERADLIKIAQWILATAAISASTSFAVIRFAYSDFETQRTTDVYRQQMEKRLDEIGVQLVEINRKIDRILLKQISDE